MTTPRRAIAGAAGGLCARVSVWPVGHPRHSRSVRARGMGRVSIGALGIWDGGPYLRARARGQAGAGWQRCTRGPATSGWQPDLPRSSPSVAVASRWRRTARCSTTTCSRCADAARPRVCFLPTASGDADHYVVRFYRRFSADCEASHVSLFRRDQGTGGVEDDLATHLLSQDLIYVGGGNVVSMLGAWRAHGLDAILRKAWRRGIVLCGPSAGLAVLVRAGAQRLPRRAPVDPRPRPAALLQLRPLRRRARAARGVPPLRRRRHARRLRGRRRRRAALPRHEPRARRQLARARATPTAWSRSAARRGARDRASRACGAARRGARAGRRMSARPAVPRARAPDLRDGRRRLHDGAAQPAARRLRAVARARGRAADPVPADRLGRHHGADQRLPRALRGARAASPSTCRCSGCASRAARCARSCSSRTSSTWAAARCATCSRSGARTGSTRCSWRRGGRAPCSPA